MNTSLEGFLGKEDFSARAEGLRVAGRLTMRLRLAGLASKASSVGLENPGSGAWRDIVAQAYLGLLRQKSMKKTIRAITQEATTSTVTEQANVV